MKIIIEIVKYGSEGFKVNRYETTEKDSCETMTNLGYNVTGVNNNHRQRAELQNKPRVGSLLGPMWGGMAGDVPVIRYEDDAAYDTLSK